MKNILIATAALAAMATGANAQVVQSANWTVSGTVPAQCGVTTQSTTVAIPAGTIVNANSRLRENALQNALISGFNATDTRAWCSGTENRANLRRTALVRTETSPANGFAEAILFDLGIDIPGTSNPSEPSYDEGTSDGGGAGQLTERFGPNGQGAPVNFVADTFGSDGLEQPILIDKPLSASENGSTTDFSPFAGGPNTRLASGTYTGDVSLTFSPGV